MKGPIKKIMVHIDGTEQSITAAQYAICLSRILDAELTAIYVVNTRALTDLVKTHIFLKTEQDEYQEDLETDAQRYLNHVTELAGAKGLSINTIKLNGTVHTEVKKQTTEQNIDLLVIGELSHIRSRRDEFYNETERAMRGVSCSVLIVKDEERVLELYESLV